MDLWEASLVYIVSSRPHRITKWDPVSNRTKQTNNNKNKMIIFSARSHQFSVKKVKGPYWVCSESECNFCPQSLMTLFWIHSTTILKATPLAQGYLGHKWDSQTQLAADVRNGQIHTVPRIAVCCPLMERRAAAQTWALQARGAHRLWKGLLAAIQSPAKRTPTINHHRRVLCRI